MSAALDLLKPHLYLVRWCLVALLAVMSTTLGYRLGASHWRGKYVDEVKARAIEDAAHAATLHRLAESTAQVAAKTEAASRILAERLRRNNTRYEEAMKDAKSAQRDLAVALRRGTVQLRPEWSCAAPGSGTDAAAAVAGRQDEAAGLRWTGAADLVAAGDRADAWITWLQRELIDTRQAVVAAGCALER